MKQRKAIESKFNKVVTKEECQKYIEEIYLTFKEQEFISVDVNSSKADIKYFLKRVTNHVINEKELNGYNYPNLGYIHSYFINKGWINIYKSMELFLRCFYPYYELTEWFLEYNIKNGDRESMEYKVKHFYYEMPEWFDYKKDEKIKHQIARKLTKQGSIDGLLAVAEFNYGLNRWNSNRNARKAAIKVFYNAHNPNDKLEAIKLFLSHQVKVNYKFGSNFDIYKVIDEVNKYKGYKNWMHCLHLIAWNLIEGYGCKVDINKAKEVFTMYSGYSLETIKDDNKFMEIIESYYQNEYEQREKELNLI